MYIHDEVGSATRKRRRLDRHASDGTTDVCDENFAFRRRQAPGKVNHLREECVVELAEIMGLPVIASPRREQWVKRLLPTRKWMEPDHIGDGLAELAKRCQELFALTSVAQKAYGDDHHLPAMPLFRQERQRWCLAQHHPGCELFWSLRHKRAIIAQ